MAGNWFGDWRRPYWNIPEPVPEETTTQHGSWESWADTDAAKKAKEEEKNAEEKKSGRTKK